MDQLVILTLPQIVMKAFLIDQAVFYLLVKGSWLLPFVQVDISTSIAYIMYIFTMFNGFWHDLRNSEIPKSMAQPARVWCGLLSMAQAVRVRLSLSEYGPASLEYNPYSWYMIKMSVPYSDSATCRKAPPCSERLHLTQTGRAILKIWEFQNVPNHFRIHFSVVYTEVSHRLWGHYLTENWR